MTTKRFDRLSANGEGPFGGKEPFGLRLSKPCVRTMP